MNLILRTLTVGLCSLLLASLAGSQETPTERGKKKAHKRGGDTPVLIPASEAKPEEDAGASKTPATPPKAQQGGDSHAGHDHAGHDHGAGRSVGAQDVHRLGGRDAASDPDPSQPRPTLPRATKPFATVRPLLKVDGVAITSEELNDLVVYYQGFRQNVVDMHLRKAVNALMPRKVLESMYSKDLPAMKQRIELAVAEYKAGAKWADMVAKYSDDAEAENPEGIYTLGRERAVQPFDLYSHTGTKSKLVGPFLTVYGYHVLEILEYNRGVEAKDDEAKVRHILVMYPELKKMDADGKDIRKFIKTKVKEAKVTALEAAATNLVPMK